MLQNAAVGLFISLIYGSFLEWFVHRVVMHTTTISKTAWRTHAIEHHSDRRSLKSFYVAPALNERYKLGESSVIPLLWFGHLPLYYAIGHFITPAAGVGAAIGGILYLLGYEFIHFFIHTPKNHWWQRTKVFRFYCEYHRIHHGHARVNFNVVMPLADVILRTGTLRQIEPEPSRPEFMKADTGPASVWRS